MKKTLSFVLILIVFSTSAFARPIKRIKFAKGATEIVIAGQLNGFKDLQVYLINLRDDQNFTVEGIGNNRVSISVTGPGGEDVNDYAADCHSDFNLPKTKKGDYKIVVTECMKADPWKGSFRIKVSIANN
jgi:hypothetical protein